MTAREICFPGESPFSHSAFEVKTLAMAMLGCGYRDATKNAWSILRATGGMRGR